MNEDRYYATTIEEIQSHLDKGGVVIEWLNWGQHYEIDRINEEFFNDDTVFGWQLVPLKDLTCE